jgi:hypothetical protein
LNIQTGDEQMKIGQTVRLIDASNQYGKGVKGKVLEFNEHVVVIETKSHNRFACYADGSNACWIAASSQAVNTAIFGNRAKAIAEQMIRDEFAREEAKARPYFMYD